jgi:di/tricarboxylate transporter
MVKNCPPLMLRSMCICVVRPIPDSPCFRFIFSVMFSPTIMLLIGGFTIASALSKTAIDRILITKVLSLAGTRPSTVLLAFMGVACFASMWIRFVYFSPLIIVAHVPEATSRHQRFVLHSFDRYCEHFLPNRRSRHV